MLLAEQNFEAVKQALNAITFSGCEGVLIGDVLHYPIRYTNISFSWKKPLRILYDKVHILKRIFINRYSYKRKGKSLFLFSSSYAERNEQRKVFFKLTELFFKSSYACYDGIPHFSLYKLRYLRLLFRWKKIIKTVTNDALLRSTILKFLFVVFCDYKDAELQFDFSRIDTLISWCDCHPVDSFFTQKFNLMGKNTVELMHGSIGDRGNNKWSVLGIKSKNFIADSRYTQDILQRNNYAGKIFVCGYVYNIDNIFPRNKSQGLNSLGIILSGENTNYHDANLNLCNDIATLKTIFPNCKFYCKLHPSSRKSNYPQEIWLPFTEVYEAEISSAEFLSIIDVAIICPSTVIYEALYHGIPFLVHADKEGLYKLYEMPEEITVHNYEELLTKIEKAMSGDYNSIYERLAEYYTTQGNVKDNYLKTFHELGIY